jgi:hypothetical protein
MLTISMEFLVYPLAGRCLALHLKDDDDFVVVVKHAVHSLVELDIAA